MNQFSDNQIQTHADKNARNSQVDTPPNDTDYELMESKADRLESTINRLIAEDSNYPNAHSSSSEFDVLDYARLSAQPPTRLGRATGERSDNNIRHYAESDPYIDPAELESNEVPSILANNPPAPEDELTAAALVVAELNPRLVSANQTLEEIDAFQERLNLLDSSSEPPTSTPKFNLIEAVPPKTEYIDANQVNIVSAATNWDDQLPPVSWFSETTTNATTKTQPTPPSKPVVPLLNQATGEPIFDVRDFSDSADGVIEPIPGSFEVEPDLFEFTTMDQLNTTDISRRSANEPEQSDHASQVQPGPPTESQVFVTGSGDIIHVNGADGFDHIDLACYDVRLATFGDHVIKVDDGQGTSFEIHYRDVAYALFAEGVEVRLDSGELE